ncbi:MAG: efflux RND transporter periplasmic adaptor subunit [Gemmatimonadota bacterium]
MWKRIAAFGLLVGLGPVLVSGCSRTEGAEAQPSGEEVLRTVNVEVMEVEPTSFSHFIRVVGTVEAERDVKVAAEEGGVVASIGATKGETVRPGEPLLRLNADVLEAQLEQTASQAALAEETWERQRRLWEEDSVGTEMAYLQAKYNAQTARAQARVLSERVARTTVRAPIGGILDDRLVEVGSMVSAGAPVARILDVDTVEVVGGVPERYAADVERGAEVAVSVDALGGREYAGTIDFVGSAVDGGSRTFQVEVTVPNPGLGIKPGMVADIRIARRTLESALAVPRTAVMRRENGYVVFVARRTEDGWRAETRSVVPGAGRDEWVVIEQGLAPGERIVTVGQQRLAEGDALRITNGPPAGGESSNGPPAEGEPSAGPPAVEGEGNEG